MSAFPHASIPSPAAQDLLLQQLLRVETMLLDSRARFMENFEREISLIRGWQSALHQTGAFQAETKQPSRRFYATPEPPESWFEEDAGNIVHLSAADFTGPGLTMHEAQPDPLLAQATVDELNAALLEAFKMMSASGFEAPSMPEPPENQNCFA